MWWSLRVRNAISATTGTTPTNVKANSSVGTVEEENRLETEFVESGEDGDGPALAIDSLGLRLPCFDNVGTQIQRPKRR